MEIASKYNPASVENKWYDYWMRHNLFHSEPDQREPYTIVIPPPNVTGILHMGHMLNNTIQDILVRRARMQGKNACWVPGTDHASIATEAKVVNKLAKEGIKKSDLTRQEFLKHAWEWTNTHGGIIMEQLKKLGASCDWQRTCFTMDEKRSSSVIKVFVDLYKKGLIYRGVRMINWDPVAQTALSDEEVTYKEHSGKLYYLKYLVEGENDYAIVATTRPETIFGDVAVCINPDDPKTARFRGKRLIVPIVNRSVPVIEDPYVDPEFGTGLLKVTPAHDINDYALGEKHNLEQINIFNDDATLNKQGLHYQGKDRFAVRHEIENELASKGLLEKAEPYTNKVGCSERTDAPIEPKLSAQWFLKMEELAKPALAAVMDDTIHFVPEKFKNTYRHWMENIRDWNISRQLWWGHQIPAYYLPDGTIIVAESLEQALAEAQKIIPHLQPDQLKQDEDCLDTWFSSWLWPISVFDGINHPENKDIQYYYPTNDLITGPDIIFFWVARMIVAGYEYKQQPCFKNVYFTGIVRDKLGRKMSKQLGNSPDPIELIDTYGADGVRMGLLLTAPAGNDIPFDESLCEQGRNFNNKIWNAFRLIKGWQTANIPQPETARIAIEWFQAKLDKTVEEIDDLFSKYRLSEALMAVYKLFWDEFSAWYLEIVKPPYAQPIDKNSYEATLTFFDALLRLLHPFMPFITEELWQALTERNEGESIMTAQQPQSNTFDKNLVAQFEQTKEIITAIRSIRLQRNIPHKEALTLHVLGKHNEYFDNIITKVCNLATIQKKSEKEATDVSFLVGTTEFAIPLAERTDVKLLLKKQEEELQYLEGFLQSVLKKLGNERFVQNAKPEIVANERKKQADAESKIATLKENIAKLKAQ